MKKIIIFFVIVIAIIASVWYIYEQKKISNNNLISNNNQYEQLLNKTISGTELTTYINKVIDDNINNKVEKNHSGIYKDKKKNSISIKIKFIDSDDEIPFERIYENDVRRFIKLYGNQDFKCTNIEYHKKTNMIKSLYFEEV